LTVPLLLPVAMIIAPVQESPPGTQVPPIAIPAPAPAQSTPDAAPQTQSEAPTPADSDAVELADPLADPETTPSDHAAMADAGVPEDPLEGFNRAMFGVHQGLDKALYRPVAMGYKHVVPKPVRSGLRNFFRNLSEPVVFLNYLLQLRFGKAGRTLVRFGINSTVGLGGLVDVAASKEIGLPYKENNFGDTLAYYGVGPGPYLFLPLTGPTTLRDILGGPLDGSVLRIALVKPFGRWEYQVSSAVISGLDRRAESDPELRALFAGAVDPYATLRSVWLQNRAAEVSELRHHRRAAPSVPELTDPLQDPAASPEAPPSDARELQDPLVDPAAVTPH